MKPIILQYQCRLLTDVVLSQTSATMGSHRTLDFIPGGCFLGVVAASLYHEANDHTFALFHSGKVRFGDAHLMKDGQRSLRVPASMHYPKLRGASGEVYIHHGITDRPLVARLQLKQCREGFYIVNENKCIQVETSKSYAQKSAYDKEQRRAKDESMFGYESLGRGLTLAFEVEIDSDAGVTADEINDALIGIRHIGRSRTAQYGMVEISPCLYGAPATHDTVGEVTVYADGRLIFLDKHGVPMYQPSVKDLGFDDPDARIDWERSQVRTFAYAPWNYRRQAPDNDRRGIEKGSVFVVRTREAVPEARYVGSYQTEGFGKVIYNPAFLRYDAQRNGIGYCVLQSALEGLASEVKKQNEAVSSTTVTPLLTYLRNEAAMQAESHDALAEVNAFIQKYKDKYEGGVSASQWGSIRSIAMVFADSKVLTAEVLNFLSHGKAQDAWEKKGRRKVLEDFMNEHENGLQEILINLASEMAKMVQR